MSNRERDTKIDPEFAKIPKDMTGFYIWRVEKLAVVPLPREKYGDFYAGDAYIVFSATNSREQGGMNIKPAKFQRTAEIHIHFWLGENCSVDERATAAYKTVELDMAFGDMPVQHREVQGFESLRFISYFPKGIRYLKGGVATGLKVADDGFRPRLFIIKGAKTPIAREIREITWERMNDGDAFVLDAGERIFIYIGKNANRKEAFEATNIAQLFKDQPGEAVVRVDDGKEIEQLTGKTLELFEKFLPLNKKKLKAHKEFMQDEKWSEETSGKLQRLFKVTDASGKVEIKQLKAEKPLKTDLNSSDCFILDAGKGVGGIWVWVGKGATDRERESSMNWAQEFLKQEKYSPNTPITRVIDGAEPFEFKAFFGNEWR
ncbi:actin depolymerising venom protein gelsolin 1-like [Paramacrobiotus metropolitanus]|uniref:actin depolymerising venom protein gelsolin 1-like n=1 Tax=Paramacrobiotus metropolitanus TaxID=2943436 RepID=UPI002445FFEE|nr:actin depolymerising venom protein gelsolin 1-like [Paramacrobiotus metropolitanus]